jgi:hypothetical protein
MEKASIQMYPRDHLNKQKPQSPSIGGSRNSLRTCRFTVVSWKKETERE